MTSVTRAAFALVALLGLTAVAQAQDLAPGRVTLRPDEVDKTASKRLGRVRGCYKESLERSSRTYGTIGVGMRIAPDGKVTDRWVALSTLADPKLETCIVAAFEGLTFPAPGGFGAVVRFGVLLKTEDSPEAPLKTQEEAYKRAIRDLPAGGPPEPGSASSRQMMIPGLEGLDDHEKFGPITTPTPAPSR
jgi:hypothetical protein